MPAIVLAAVTPLQMIRCSEHCAALMIAIEIRCGWIAHDFLMEPFQDFARVARVLGVISQAIKAALAQTRSFTSLGYKAKNVGRHSGFVTPAVSFVGVPCCDATMV
jgi:hypothetical protein